MCCILATTTACGPLVSSFSMNCGNPLLLTFLIFMSHRYQKWYFCVKLRHTPGHLQQPDDLRGCVRTHT